MTTSKALTQTAQQEFGVEFQNLREALKGISDYQREIGAFHQLDVLDDENKAVITYTMRGELRQSTSVAGMHDDGTFSLDSRKGLDFETLQAHITYELVQTLNLDNIIVPDKTHDAAKEVIYPGTTGASVLKIA